MSTKPLFEDEPVRHGVLGVPEASMGREPVYVYRDVYDGTFFMTEYPPPENDISVTWLICDANDVRDARCRTGKYVVTLWPRDAEHLKERFDEVVAFHTQSEKV